MDVSPVSGSWTEGTGLDMETYKDKGVSNWLTSSGVTGWTTCGDYLQTLPRLSPLL